MEKISLAFPVFVPFLFGALLFVLPFAKQKFRNLYVFFITFLNSAVIFLLLFLQPTGSLEVFHFTKGLVISFRIDSLTSLFAGLIAILWPLANLYAFEYMKGEERQSSFFAFYTMTYGAVTGIAFSANLLTMYVFYELLTLVTFPLVMHSMNRKSAAAGKKYMYYSLGGAAFAFIGMVFVIAYGSTMDFTKGGVFGDVLFGPQRNLLLFIYFVTFCGFSVKAALVPFHSWLISASVAPTPVTALLHAVAVVKSGAFALIRLTYYIYGTEGLQGSLVQTIVMLLALVTILYGSVMAWKEIHLKRRLAYSTISNLSYIILGITLCSPLGLFAALTHMVVHAFTKICSFFCIGALMHQSGREYISEIKGVGRKMPVVFSCFVVSALSLIGIPPLAGFLSKWVLAKAAFSNENTLALFSLLILLLSAFLTVAYMFGIIIPAFFPRRGFDYKILDGILDPGIFMKLPLILFAAIMILLGLNASHFFDFLDRLVR